MQNLLSVETEPFTRPSCPVSGLVGVLSALGLEIYAVLFVSVHSSGWSEVIRPGSSSHSQEVCVCVCWGATGAFTSSLSLSY